MKPVAPESSLSAAPLLSAYAAQQLGPERAALARPLRALLWQSGLRWPAWIDARPGLLQLLLADCVDAPLAATRRALWMQKRERLQQGLVAVGLALAAPRLAFWLPAQLPAQSSRPETPVTPSSSAIAELQAPSSFPSQPTRVLLGDAGRAFALSAEQLAAVADVLAEPDPAPRTAALISVVGAVQRPAVLSLPDEPITPRQLVDRSGGATTAAWVPLLADPIHGSIWEADRPIPALSFGMAPSVLYVLPAGHELIRRHRASPGLRQRAANACLSCTLCTDLCPTADAGTQPHVLMRALGQGASQHLTPQLLAATAGCTRCGACSVACPAELLPGAVVAAFAAELASPVYDELEPPPLPDLSRLSWPRMLTRLGLDRFASAEIAASAAIQSG